MPIFIAGYARDARHDQFRAATSPERYDDEKRGSACDLILSHSSRRLCSSLCRNHHEIEPPQVHRTTHVLLPFGFTCSQAAFCSASLLLFPAWCLPDQPSSARQRGLAFVAFHSHCQFFSQRETSGCLLLSACAVYVAQVRLNWLIINVSGYEKSWHRGGS